MRKRSEASDAKPAAVYIHSSSVVSESATIGEGTKVWCYAQIRERAKIGKNCNIGNGAYIDTGVEIGNNVTVHNKALLYRNLRVEDDAFIGPAVVFANDKAPRSGKTRDLTGVSWVMRKGASIGASSVIMPDVNIGRYAMIGSHSVVTRDVPDHALAFGSPARVRGFVCECGEVLQHVAATAKGHDMVCPACRKRTVIGESAYSQIRNA